MASASAFGYPGFQQTDSKTPDANTYLNFSVITPAVQKHLQKVYLTLASCLLVVALGAYAHIALNLGGFLSYAGTLLCVMGIAMTPASPLNENLRLSLLLGTSFFQGCSLGPLIYSVAQVDSSLISSAFLATSAVFAAFSGAALLAKRREYLYLGGICGSALSTLLAMRFASFLFGSYVLQFQLELYVGLFIFAGYVVFDTQVIIEKASAGHADYIRDALNLLLDFVALFVRILIILTKDDKNKERKESKNTKRR